MTEREMLLVGIGANAAFVFGDALKGSWVACSAQMCVGFVILLFLKRTVRAVGEQRDKP